MEKNTLKKFCLLKNLLFIEWLMYIYIYMNQWQLSVNQFQFLPGSGHIDTAIWMHYMDADKTAGEETRWQLHKNAACNPEQVLAATPHKTPTVRPPAPYHENYSS